MSKETLDLEIQKAEWLESVNEEAKLIASKLSAVFECEVVPIVFVVEPLKDAAAAFAKKPNAMQGFKLIRQVGEIGWESGVKLIVQTQLIRENDLAGRVEEAIPVSDARFMDVEGNYPAGCDDLNLGLLLRMQSFLSPYIDQFKKK